MQHRLHNHSREKDTVMTQAKQGDRVRIDYTGRLADGTVFDSTSENMDCDADGCDTDEHDSGDCGCGCESGPRVVTIGTAELFPQVDEALLGMAPGEKKTFTILADDAFGEYDQEKVFTVPRCDLPDDLTPEVGDELILSNEDDEELGVVVIDVTNNSITFDANHPLAGENLSYEIQLVDILL
jgi:peptidylprolyl isomerase